MAVPALLFGASAARGQSRTYTTNADFDLGSLARLNHASVQNQLQLDESTSTFSFIWLPASTRGTVVRIDAPTGTVLGEYSTAPEGHGRDPSRTAVDAAGNVWAANRAESSTGRGSVVQLGLVLGGTRVRKNADGSRTPDPTGAWLAPPFDHCTCVDRDADGLIRTSRGLRDVLAWPDVTDGSGGESAEVEDAEDECIRLFQRTNAPSAYHVSLDGAGDVWVGSFPGAVFDRLDGHSGRILQSLSLPGGGYGGLVDAHGVLWSASFDRNVLLRWDPATGSTRTIPVMSSYGLTTDALGNLWNTMWSQNSVTKIDPDGDLGGSPLPSFGAGPVGVVVTSDGDVWVANANTNAVSRLSPEGVLRKRLIVGLAPQGLAVDEQGKVWVANRGSNTVQRIDPRAGTDGLGAIDRTVLLGSGAGPQPYGCMSGSVQVRTFAAEGSWTVVFDGERTAVAWGLIDWTGVEPPGTRLDVAVRAAESPPDLQARDWTAVANHIDFRDAHVVGRFLEIRVVLGHEPGTNLSPVLEDLTVSANRTPECSQAHPSLERLWPPDGRMVPVEILGLSDPDGDPVTCTITRVTQDEPVRDGGAGPAKPDAEGVGTPSVKLRAERSGGFHATGDGRVYEVLFAANDGKGGTCSGSVRVCVPHDRAHDACGDDGQLYDSTEVPGPKVWLHPNPFNPSTTISYVLPASSPVHLTIYDVLGRQVRVLRQDTPAAGEQSLLWDGRDDAGKSLASGVYVYRLVAGSLQQSGRMLMVK